MQPPVVQATPIQINYADHKPGLLISVRPEIRKGCVWDINLKFSKELLQREKIRYVYLEKPRTARDVHYLCLKVRSKLIRPRREIAFRKVANIDSDVDRLEINETGNLVLKARFTQRPRAVFHKHADVMIFIASIKTTRSDRVIVTDEHELIFRGGTGSVHSADSRKKSIRNEEKKKMTAPNAFHMQYLKYLEKGEALPRPVYDLTSASSLYNDFVANQGECLAAQPELSDLFQTYDSLEPPMMASAVTNTVPESMFLPDGGVNQQMNQMNQMSQMNQMNVFGAPTNQFVSDQSMDFGAPTGVQVDASGCKFTTVFDVRRGMCKNCTDECEVYQGRGGACENCGCYPAHHENLDNPKSCKRKRDDEEMDGPPHKRKKYLLESRFYQRLFFKSLNFMTLDELCTVCQNAPLPFFVKDETGVYKYVNPAFCFFILDSCRINDVLDKDVSQILSDKHESTEVMKHDKYLFSHEGEIKTFDVCVNKQDFRVMKLFTTLRDGKKYLIGAVISDT